MQRIICGFMCTLSFSLLSASSTMSQTIWNDGTGDWFTPANWTPPGPPTATDDAEINNGGTAQIGAAGAVAQRLTLGNNNTDSGTVSVGAGGNLAVSLNLTVGEFGQGTFNVTGGGIAQTDELTLGLQNGSMGTVLVDGAGSKLTQGVFATASVVGDFGTGNLTVSNGGFYKYAALFVGNNANGNGTVLIESGGTADTASFGGSIGNEATAVGVVTVDGAGSMWTSGVLDIGISGTGTVNITGGGNITSTQGFVGASPGGIGTVNVSGNLSTWTLSGTLDVGLDGNGSLNITNGGTVTVNGAFARIAEHATSTSSVTVDGLGSTWTLASELDVARDGTGTLMIQNRGTVNMTGSGRASIGVDAGSNGTVTVDGAGSTWTNSASLVVGDSGMGTLNITNGG
jgi:T5SS/PEP-CTERM-associated repeat protein